MNHRTDQCRLSLLALVSFLAGMDVPAAAQDAGGASVITEIVPDVDPSFGLGTQIDSVADVHTIDGGTLAGTNLFHSFASFSLAQAETARWVQSSGDPGAITNVINRVTGGNQSFISGTLDSTALPNAAFWFLNPAGILVGENAQIDVPGAAHFSTASSLQFADGSSFQIAAPDGSTLTVAAPEAFGFLGGEGAIAFEETQLLRTQDTFSVTASDVFLRDSFWDMKGLLLAAVGSEAATVFLDQSPDSLLTGHVSISNMLIQTAARETDTVLRDFVMLGGSVNIDGSEISVGGLDSSVGGDLVIVADTIDVSNFTRLGSFSTGSGNGGSLRLTAGSQLRLTNNSFIQVVSAGAGDSGDLLVSATDLELSGNSGLTSNSFGGNATGKAGNIRVDVRNSVRLIGGGYLSTFASGEVPGGDLDVSTGSLELTGSSFLFSSSLLGATKDGGDIRVIASESITLSDQSLIQGSTASAGNGGDVYLQAPEISIDTSLFAALTFAEGNGGNLTVVAAGQMHATNATFFTSSLGSGNTGSISLTGGEVALVNSSFSAEQGRIDGDQVARGIGGNITITAAGALSITGGQITNQTLGAGDAGDIVLRGDSVLLSDTGILSSTNNSDDIPNPGNAGDISITAAGRVDLIQVGIASDAFALCSACIGGNAGSIAVQAADIAMIDSRLSNRVQGSGDAGTILVNALGTFTMERSSFSAEAFSETSGSSAGVVSVSAAGDINITDSEFNVDASTENPLVEIAPGRISLTAGGSLAIRNSFFASRTGNAGAGGDIVLKAAGLLSVNTSVITSDTNGFGDAGEIMLTASEIDLDNIALLSDSTGAGDAGSVRIDASRIRLSNDTEISTSAFDRGAGGNITITGETLEVDNSLVRSNTSTECTDADCVGAGRGGSVAVKIGALTLTQSGESESSISARTRGTSDAGSVTIDAGLLTIDGGAITSSATEASSGKAGTVQITARTLGLRNNGEITSSTSASGDAGDIAILADTVQIDGGTITSATEPGSTGNAGSVSINAATLTMRNGANISVRTSDVGDAGTISLTGGTLDALDSFIDSSSQCNSTLCESSILGDAGNIDIRMDSVRLGGFASVFTVTDSAGNAGNINVTTDELVLRGEAIDENFETRSSLNSSTRGSGRAGIVTVNAGLIDINTGSISSDTTASGNAGAVNIAARNIALVDGEISSSTSAGGNAGAVSINFADTLLLSGRTGISSRAGDGSAGTAGRITITSEQGRLGLADYSLITSDTSGTGDAGGVFVLVANLALGDRAGISSSTASLGDAGLVDITARQMAISGDARVASSTSSNGKAGRISVATQSLRVAGGGSIRSETSGAGDAGFITVSAEEVVIDGGQIATSAAEFSSGNAGEIDITTARLALLNQGSIVSDTGSTGKAGDIRIGADTVTLAGNSRISSDTLFPCEAAPCTGEALGGNGGSVRLDARTVALTDSSIGSVTKGAGRGGTVTVVSAEKLELRQASIDSSTSAQGNAGSIDVRAGQLLIDGGGISSASLAGLETLDIDGGNGGQIHVVANDIAIVNGGSITSSALFFGSAGNIDIETGSLSVEGSTFHDEFSQDIEVGSFISTETLFGFGPGRAGNIAIKADAIRVGSAGSISSRSSNESAAGQIRLRTGQLLIENSGMISSSNTSDTGGAGLIMIEQVDMGSDSGIALTEGGSITTNAINGPAGDIILSMTPGALVRLESEGRDSVIATNSDNNTAGQVSISNPFAVILRGGSITALGETGAKLDIQTQYFIRSSDRANPVRVNQGEEPTLGEYDVSGGTVAANLSVLDASKVLRGQCPAARSSGQFSQFIARPIGPYSLLGPGPERGPLELSLRKPLPPSLGACQ